MNIELNSLNQLPEVATKLIKIFKDARIIAFYGDMGAGKTTIIKQLCKNLHVKDEPTSPTFSVVNEYKTKSGETIYHFDFYRIETEEEAYDLGYEDYLYSGNFCFIEWPEKIKNILPQETLKVKVKIKENNNRLISIVS